MPSDLTRPATGDLRQHYKAVVMQQGRVILDRDFNALQDLVNGRIAADALDEIGPCGTPDDGLAVSLPPAGQSVPASVSYSAPQPWDFLVKPGTMYVGGQRVVFDAPAAHLAPLSYFHQPDWIHPPDPFAHGSASYSVPRHEFVFLHAFEQEVGAVEDPDLLDVALGGPDTTQRVRLMRRIIRLGVAGTDCATALADAETDWGQWGYLFDPATMRLLPQAALQVSFTSALTTTNPCDPVTQGGYLGAENQLIRVMIGEPGSGGKSASLLWGYDNASFLYRVTVEPGGTTLQLSQPPVDAFHCPRTGQYVEVLRTAAVLGIEPDQTDPTGQRTIVRCVAAATGRVATVAKYNNGDNTLVLSSPLPAEYATESYPLFLRVWVGRQPFDPSSVAPITLTDPTGQTSPGIQVTMTQPATAAKGAALPGGAFWLFAVRPSTPQAIYPERFLNGPQPPDGPRQWVCPLAVIDWASRDSVSVSTLAFSAPSAVIHDCRCHFDNLVTLTNRRLGGCCTVTVWPSDAPRLQPIIDRASRDGRRVTVCLMPGAYALSQPLRLTGRHSHLVLESCSGGATLQTDPAADLTAFTDGLVVLVGADGVTCRGLTFLPSAVPFPAVSAAVWEQVGWTRSLPNNPPKDYRMLALVGLRCVNDRDLTVENCRFETPSTPLKRDQLAFSAGVLASGDCTGLSVRGCRFSAAIAPTANLPPQDFLTGPIPAALTSVAVTTAPPAVVATPAIAIIRVPAYSTLFGVLVLPALAPAVLIREGIFGQVQPTILDRTTIQDNDFHALTLALAAWSSFGTVQVRDNRVDRCLAGCWLFGADAIELYTYGLISYSVLEIDFGLFMALAYPLPAGTDTASLPRLLVPKVLAAKTAAVMTAPPASVSVPPSASVPPTLMAGRILARALRVVQPGLTAGLVKSLSAPTLAMLSVLNNCLNTIPADTTATGDSALWVALSGSDVYTDITAPFDDATSLLVASNSVYGRAGYDYVVELDVNNPTAVTGNVIVHALAQTTERLRPFALYVYCLTEPEDGVQLLVISSNVVRGDSNIASIKRFGGAAAPLNTWQLWNNEYVSGNNVQ